MKECVVYKDFKNNNKIDGCRSAFCYHHMPAIPNHVSDKIFLSRLLSTQILPPAPLTLAH